MLIPPKIRKEIRKTYTPWRWIRTCPLVGKRFLDTSKYHWGYFTVLGGFKCKKYYKNKIAPDGTHWFDMYMIYIKVQDGTIYNIPFTPQMKAVSAEDNETSMSEIFAQNPW